MDDAIFEWASEIKNSQHEAESLTRDVANLQHQVDDLAHAIQDLGTFRFNDDVEDYTIREKARGLWDVVSSGVESVRRSIQEAADKAHDTRRAAEFYKP